MNSGTNRLASAPVVVLVFALWTLFVWGGRLRNLWLDPGGFAEASRWSLVGSIAFTTLGLGVLGLWLARRFRPESSGLLRPAIWALAALTTGVWLLRGVDIALGDHELGFIVVHVVLAVVSIGLALAALSRSVVR